METNTPREQMVSQQVRTWDVFDPDVLRVLSELPREDFVPQELRALAYAEESLPLSHGQSMMIPSVEGRMLQALQLSSTDNVLEVGTGSGYTTACLAKLAGQVTSIDIHDELMKEAQARLMTLGIHNAALLHSSMQDIVSNPELSGQFDAVVITGSFPEPDPALKAGLQGLLKPNGRLFAVIGQAPLMKALLISRNDAPKGVDGFITTELFETVLPALDTERRSNSFTF